MADGEGIQVTFLDQTGAKSVKAKISPTVEVKKIIPNIITKMQLPVTAPDGTPMSYSLDHKEGGKRLQENQTLPSAGVKEGDHLIDYQAFGDPPERYLITLKGKGLIRKSESDPVEVAEVHRVEIRLGIDYPRSRPDLQWLTSIYHPNISAVGAVCLGGYSTNWVPSLGLSELCEMLWDMVRYANYDPKSAYNYAAGRWSETQTQFDFPMDPRNLRDRMTKTIGDNVIRFSEPGKGGAAAAPAPVKEA